TGTLTGGQLQLDDEMIIVGPSSVRSRPLVAKIRGLQSHKQLQESLSPGRRAAVNLGGIGYNQVRRGDALVRSNQWEPTTTMDCSLHVLAALGHEVGRRGAYHAYIGAGEHPSALRVLGPSSIQPGEQSCVRVRIPHPLPLLPGDRYVLRESGRSETVGGGEILDVAPVLPASRARPTRSSQRVVAERGWIEADLLERLTGEKLDPNVGRWLADPAVLAKAEEAVRRSLEVAGPKGVDLAHLDERLRAVVSSGAQNGATKMGGVTIRKGRAYLDTASPVDSLARHPFALALAEAGFRPPDPTGVDRGELRRLVEEGVVVERDGAYFAPDALDEAA
ncbi:MAG: EF-Tu/IF-2/RF-3 family GTPase, partial [Acidimicrobiales bacterium]